MLVLFAGGGGGGDDGTWSRGLYDEMTNGCIFFTFICTNIHGSTYNGGTLSGSLEQTLIEYYL